MRISFVLTMASAIFLTSLLIYLHTYICYGQQNFFNNQNFKKQHGLPTSQANKPFGNNLTDGKPQLQLHNRQIQAESFEPAQPMPQPTVQPVPNTQAFPVNCNHGFPPGPLEVPQQQALPNYSPQVTRFQPSQQFTRPTPSNQPQYFNPPTQNRWPAVPVAMETPPRPYIYDGLKNDALPYPNTWITHPQYIPLQQYPVNTVIADQSQSSLQTLLPIIINLLKEKSCPCRSCDCNCSNGYCKKKYPLSDDGPEIEAVSEEMSVRNVREPKKEKVAESEESSEHEEHEE